MKAAKKWVSAAVTALLLIIFILNPIWMLEHRLQDLAYQRPGLPYHNIVVIGIDDWALSEFGRWPWSRQVWADVINILNRYEDARPATIALDIVFDQPAHDSGADAALAEAVARSDNVVLASLVGAGFDFYNISLDMAITDHIMSFPDLRPHGIHGVVNGLWDDDGVVREAPLRIEFNGEMLYSFPVAAAMKYTGLDFDELIDFGSPEGHIYTYIRYTGRPGDFFWFSVADLFDEFFDPMMLAGTVVMIGPWALGMMDSFAVPIAHGVPMYGVEIHANVLQMILDGTFKQRVPQYVEWIILAVMLAAGMLLGERLNIRYALIVFLVIGAGYFFGAMGIYQQGYVLPLLVPLLALAIVFLYQLSYGYALEALEKSRLRNTFRKYVDPELVDKLIESKEADSDEVGRKKHIAVLFVDLQGFTPVTEAFKDTPEVIVEILNSYLELTASAIFNNGGSVDKFIGDAAMGLFNGFVPLDDYVYKAVKAGWDMVAGEEELIAAIKEKTGADLGFRVGIHCGEAIVGNLGPSFRKDYTAIGDVVNTAARLESSAGRSQIYISRDVYEIVKDRVEAQAVGEISLKGKSELMVVYYVIGLKKL